jgi:hypothetical protein
MYELRAACDEIQRSLADQNHKPKLGRREIQAKAVDRLWKARKEGIAPQPPTQSDPEETGYRPSHTPPPPRQEGICQNFSKFWWVNILPHFSQLVRTFRTRYKNQAKEQCITQVYNIGISAKCLLLLINCSTSFNKLPHFSQSILTFKRSQEKQMRKHVLAQVYNIWIAVNQPQSAEIFEIVRADHTIWQCFAAAAGILAQKKW